MDLSSLLYHTLVSENQGMILDYVFYQCDIVQNIQKGTKTCLWHYESLSVTKQNPVFYYH